MQWLPYVKSIDYSSSSRSQMLLSLIQFKLKIEEASDLEIALRAVDSCCAY